MAQLRPALTLGALLALLFVTNPAHTQETAQQIVDAALDKNATGFQTGAVEMTVTTEDKGGAQKIRRLSAMSKRAPQGQRTRVKLLAPDEVKGQSFLFKEQKEAEDLVYWYLPAFAVTRRIQGEGKKGTFMGTHLTYADLESRDIKNSTYRKLKDESIGKHAVYVIEAKPKKPADSDYSRVLFYVRKSDKMPLKVKFFAKGNPKQESKIMFMEKIDKQGERTYVKQMSVRPSEGGYTRIIIDAIDFDRDIPDIVFTPEDLANQ